MSLAVKVCQEQALRAYYNMLSLFDRGHLDIKTKLSFFDQMVLWGGSMVVYNIKEGRGQIKSLSRYEIIVDKLHI